MSMRISNRKLWPTLAAFLTFAFLLGVGIYRAMPAGESKSMIGGSFELTDHRGQRVTQAAYAGSHMLIYFGYTYCPDICPFGLQNMMAAYDELPESRRRKVIPIFITVDPERDTVQVMAGYVVLFHPDLIGLTGNRAEIDAAANAYGIYHAKAQEGGNGADYLVDHTALFLLVGPDGNHIRQFGHDASQEEIAAGIAEVLDP